MLIPRFNFIELTQRTLKRVSHPYQLSNKNPNLDAGSVSFQSVKRPPNSQYYRRHLQVITRTWHMMRGTKPLLFKIITGSVLIIGLLLAAIWWWSGPSELDHQFSTQTYSEDYLQRYRNFSERTASIESLPTQAQLDSLLHWAQIIRNLDEDTAFAYAQTAEQIASLEFHPEGMAYSSYYLGLIRGRVANAGEDLEIPLAYAQISSRLFSGLDNEEWAIRALALNGTLFNLKKERDSATYYLKQALVQLDEADLDTMVEHSLRGELYHVLADVKAQQDSLEAAAHFRKLAKQNYLISNDKTALSRLNLSIAKQFKQQGDSIGGEALLNEVLADLRSSKDQYGLFYALERVGIQKLRDSRSNNDTTQVRQAQQYLWEALELQPEKAYNVLKNLGLGYEYLGYFAPGTYASLGVDSAIIYYRRGMETARQAGAMDAFQQMSERMVKLCDYLQTNTDRRCDTLLDSPVLTLINDNYEGALQKITTRLESANRDLMAFEMRQQQELSSRNRRNILFGGGAILAIVGLIFFSVFQSQRRKQAEARMATLRAQINPHFMSNSLNAIESLVNFGDRKDAAKYLIHFSRLTRRVLNSSLVPTTSLASELATMKHFLALEQLRLGDRLSYSIDVAEGLNSDAISIPSMILQPYIENAIWHGIKPKTGPGHISVYCEREDRLLVCTIEDDGIGRQAAAERKKTSVLKQKSVGMKITQERIEAAGRSAGSGVEIVDLTDPDGNARGTRVVIRLPFKTIKTATV